MKKVICTFAYSLSVVPVTCQTHALDMQKVNFNYSTLNARLLYLMFIVFNV